MLSRMPREGDAEGWWGAKANKDENWNEHNVSDLRVCLWAPVGARGFLVCGRLEVPVGACRRLCVLGFVCSCETSERKDLGVLVYGV